VRPPRHYYWLLWTVLRAEVAVALDDREVAARCYADLAPWAGTLAGVASGSVTLGPVAMVLADLAAALGRPAAERTGHLRRAVEVARELGSPHWEAAARRALDQ
jgi:hypothetical protein